MALPISTQIIMPNLIQGSFFSLGKEERLKKVLEDQSKSSEISI